jgi:hypothetical protein
MKLGRGAIPLAVGVTLTAAALAAPLAQAEPNRAEYVAQLEPVCQANTKANLRILRRVRAKVKKGKLRLAGRQFSRASAAFGSTVAQIAATPQPAADAAALANWLHYLHLETSYLRKLGKALKAGKTSRAQGFAVRLTRNANLANAAVFGFGFNNCRINPSDFT